MFLKQDIESRQTGWSTTEWLNQWLCIRQRKTLWQPCVTAQIFKIECWVKEVRIYTMCFHLHKVKKLAKQTDGVKVRNCAYLGGFTREEITAPKPSQPSCGLCLLRGLAPLLPLLTPHRGPDVPAAHASARAALRCPPGFLTRPTQRLLSHLSDAAPLSLYYLQSCSIPFTPR